MIDYLIIGQGLAGSLISHFLLKENKNIRVLDRAGGNSSRVAAGLYNPVTGRKMVRTWNADQLFEGLEDFYQSLEMELDAQFLTPKRIYRPFLNLAEQNDWQGRASDPLYHKFIHKIHTQSLYPGIVDDPVGGLELANSGYLDTNRFLNAMENYLISKEVLLYDTFRSEDLVMDAGAFEWKGIRSKGVIFCDGVDSKDNKYFDWLPIHPLKGELLHIKSSVKLRHIINRGVFIMGMGNEIFKVGSTYNWRDPYSGTTEEGKADLLERLGQIFRSDFEITNHYSGIRPSTKDRRPFIGGHPEIKNMWIFNGLGTKGVTLGPYFAKLFIDNLVNNKALDPVVNINRYYLLYNH